jgi:hypothetical protein
VPGYIETITSVEYHQYNAFTEPTCTKYFDQSTDHNNGWTFVADCSKISHFFYVSGGSYSPNTYNGYLNGNSLILAVGVWVDYVGHVTTVMHCACSDK